MLIAAGVIAGFVAGFCGSFWAYRLGKSVGADSFYDAGFHNGYRAALSEHGIAKPWGKSDLIEDMEQSK